MKNIFDKLFLPAGSLLYALFISIIIAIIIGGLLLVSNLYNNLEATYESTAILQTKANNCFTELLQNVNQRNEKVNSEVNNKKWGLYNILTCEIVNYKDTISKMALVGEQEYRYSNLALYLADKGNALKLAGKTIIKGDIKMSDFGIKTIYINKLLFSGNYCNSCITPSQKEVPKLKEMNILAENKSIHMNYSEIKDADISNNSFRKPTIVVHCNVTRLTNCKLNGNFHIVSNDSISISASCDLTDVIIKAPTVNIEDDLEGNFQIFAKKHIYVGDNVMLNYPSVLYLNSSAKGGVTIGSNVVIAGAVVVTGNNSMFDRFRYLSIDKNSTILGQVYCKGKMQLKGKVYGSIMANTFYLETGETSYDNTLLDVTIDNNMFPNKYAYVSFFNSDIRNEKVLIKYLQ